MPRFECTSCKGAFWTGSPVDVLDQPPCPWCAVPCGPSGKDDAALATAARAQLALLVGEPALQHLEARLETHIQRQPVLRVALRLDEPVFRSTVLGLMVEGYGLRLGEDLAGRVISGAAPAPTEGEAVPRADRSPIDAVEPPPCRYCGKSPEPPAPKHASEPASTPTTSGGCWCAESPQDSGASWSQEASPEPPPPVVPALGHVKTHRCRPTPGACEVCGRLVPVLRRDLIDSAWLRGVARYLRQCQSLEGIQAVLVAEIAQRAERLASDLDWCLSFVDGLEEVRPGAANEIARLACSEAPAPRFATGDAPVAAPWPPASTRSPDGPGDVHRPAIPPGIPTHDSTQGAIKARNFGDAEGE